jgi:hypothetical protein
MNGSFLMMDFNDLTILQRKTIAKQTSVLLVLEALSNDKFTSVLEAVAKSKIATPEILSKLANKGDIHLLKTVLTNENTTEDMIIHFCSPYSGEQLNALKKAAIKNPNCPESFLEDFFQSDISLRKMIAKHNKSSLKVLSTLVFDPNNNIRIRASLNFFKKITTNSKTGFSITDNLFEMLYGDSISPEKINNVLTNPNPIERLLMAQNPNTQPHVLDILASDKEISIRVAVASHKNTSPDTLAELCKDKKPVIRQKVASNPNTKIETLELIANKEKTQSVVWSLWLNPNINEGIIRAAVSSKFAKTTDALVKALCDKSCSEDLIEFIYRKNAAENIDEQVILFSVSHLNCPPWIIEEVCQGNNPFYASRALETVRKKLSLAI